MQAKGVRWIKFPDGVIPPKYNQVFLARWAGIPAWELDAHPEWHDAYETCCSAFNLAENELRPKS